MTGASRNLSYAQGSQPNGSACAPWLHERLVALLGISLLAGCSSTSQVPAPTSLTLTPSTAALPAGTPLTLHATATPSASAPLDVTALANWTTSDPSLASIDQGHLTTLAPGFVRVRATYAGASAESAITIGPPAPVNLVVRPDPLVLPKGASRRLTVQGVRWSDGHLEPAPTEVFWASSQPYLVLVDAAGLVSAHGVGSASVTASIGALNGSAQVSVTRAEPVALLVEPAVLEVPLGAQRQLQVAATLLSDGSSGPSPQGVVWTSQDPTQAPVDAEGQVRGLKLGAVVQVFAVAGAASGSALVRVLDPQPATLLVEPAVQRVVVGQQVAVQVTVLDSNGAAHPPAVGDEWHFGLDPSGVLDVRGPQLAVGWTPGRADLAVVFTSPGGAQLETRVEVEVEASPIVELSLTPSKLDLPLGFSRDLFAWGKTATGELADLTSRVRWTSEDAGVAQVDATGRVLGANVGSTWVVARFGNLGARVVVNVLRQRVVFVTSERGTGNLSTWPSAGGKTGLAAADQVCQRSAARAGLPGEFRAWLSSMDDDAFCRVQRLPGKRDEGCGFQPTLPGAGPWIRTDGYSFVRSFEDLLSGKVLVPLRYTEKPAPLGKGVHFWTASDEGGSAWVQFAGTCLDWTDGTGISEVGSPDRSRLWGNSRLEDCARSLALACFEVATGRGPDVAIPSQGNAKLVFVTSVHGWGVLGRWPDAQGKTGLEAGDAICQARARSGGLGARSFRAYLSGSTERAPDRVGKGPWQRLDGVPVASGVFELLGGRLFTTIGLDEFGRYLGGVGVWTGTMSSGQMANHCQDWTNASGRGMWGASDYADEHWSQYNLTLGDVDCAYEGHLYCFEE